MHKCKKSVLVGDLGAHISYVDGACESTIAEQHAPRS